MKDRQRSGLAILLMVLVTFQIASLVQERATEPGTGFALFVLCVMASIGLWFLLADEDEE